MKHLLKSVRDACDQGNWYAAIFLTLSLPDICGKLEDPKAGNGDRYKAWFRNNYRRSMMQPHIKSRLTAEDCYAIRNAIVHAGTDELKSGGAVQRVKFNSFQVHEAWVDGSGILLLDARTFCMRMVNSVEAWLVQMESKSDVKARIDALLEVEDVTFSPMPGIGFSNPEGDPYALPNGPIIS
jgi:hypothetical protein